MIAEHNTLHTSCKELTATSVKLKLTGENGKRQWLGARVELGLGWYVSLILLIIVWDCMAVEYNCFMFACIINTYALLMWVGVHPLAGLQWRIE